MTDEVSSKLGEMASQLMPFLTSTHEQLIMQVIDQTKTFKSLSGEAVEKLKHELLQSTKDVIPRDLVVKILAKSAASEIAGEMAVGIQSSLGFLVDFIYDSLLDKMESIYYSLKGQLAVSPSLDNDDGNVKGKSAGSSDEERSITQVATGEISSMGIEEEAGEVAASAHERLNLMMMKKKLPPAPPPQASKPVSSSMPAPIKLVPIPPRPQPANNNKPGPLPPKPHSSSGAGAATAASSSLAEAPPATAETAAITSHLTKDRPMGPQRRRPQRKPQRRPMMATTED